MNDMKMALAYAHQVENLSPAAIILNYTTKMFSNKDVSIDVLEDAIHAAAIAKARTFNWGEARAIHAAIAAADGDVREAERQSNAAASFAGLKMEDAE